MWRLGSGRGGKTESLGLADTNYTGWISKVQLYSVGNYIQYPLINHDGKEYEKEYICITESPYCTEEMKYDIANQLYFSKVLKIKKIKFYNSASQPHFKSQIAKAGHHVCTAVHKTLQEQTFG